MANYLVLKAVPRCEFIAWLAIRNRLSTKERLVNRGLAIDALCLMSRATVRVDIIFSLCVLSPGEFGWGWNMGAVKNPWGMIGIILLSRKWSIGKVNHWGLYAENWELALLLIIYGVIGMQLFSKGWLTLKTRLLASLEKKSRSIKREVNHLLDPILTSRYAAYGVLKILLSSNGSSASVLFLRESGKCADL